MYKIQNISQGSIPLDLEKGGIILAHGQFFDLDEVCSREWIRTNPFVQRLVAEGYIRIVHDSQEGIPNYPTGAAVPFVVPVPTEIVLPAATPPVAPFTVQIIDLSPPAPVQPVVAAVPKAEAPVCKPVEQETLPTKEEDPVEVATSKEEAPVETVTAKDADTKEEVKVSTTMYGYKNKNKKKR